MKSYIYRIAAAGPVERKCGEWCLGWDYPWYQTYDRVTAQKTAKELNKMSFKEFGNLSCKYKAVKDCGGE